METLPKKTLQDWLYDNFWGILIAVFFLLRDVVVSGVKLESVEKTLADHEIKIETIQTVKHEVSLIRHDMSYVRKDLDTLKNQIGKISKR